MNLSTPIGYDSTVNSAFVLGMIIIGQVMVLPIVIMVIISWIQTRMKEKS